MQAADLVERGAPEDHVGADAEDRVEVVLPRADEFVEDALGLGGPDRDQTLGARKGLRGLDERD